MALFLRDLALGCSKRRGCRSGRWAAATSLTTGLAGWLAGQASGAVAAGWLRISLFGFLFVTANGLAAGFGSPFAPPLLDAMAALRYPRACSGAHNKLSLERSLSWKSCCNHNKTTMNNKKRNNQTKHLVGNTSTFSITMKKHEQSKQKYRPPRSLQITVSSFMMPIKRK